LLPWSQVPAVGHVQQYLEVCEGEHLGGPCLLGWHLRDELGCRLSHDELVWWTVPLHPPLSMTDPESPRSDRVRSCTCIRTVPLVRAASVFLDQPLTEAALNQFFANWDASRDGVDWAIRYEDQVIYVADGTDDIDGMPDFILERVAELLGTEPQFRASVMFASTEGGERDMLAVAVSFGNFWPAVVWDHTQQNPPIAVGKILTGNPEVPSIRSVSEQAAPEKKRSGWRRLLS
jgi:hypothetical protein